MPYRCSRLFLYWSSIGPRLVLYWSLYFSGLKLDCTVKPLRQFRRRVGDLPRLAGTRSI